MVELQSGRGETRDLIMENVYFVSCIVFFLCDFYDTSLTDLSVCNAKFLLTLYSDKYIPAMAMNT